MVSMARSWVDEGIMQGNPPAERARVTMANYDREPFQRWSVVNMRQLFPSARVAAAVPSVPLPRMLRDLSSVTFEHGGLVRGIDDLCADTYVDALMVVHRGVVVHEHYDHGVGPDSRHVAQSVTKSVIATLAGILVRQGLLALDGPVTSYLPELAGTSWDGATLQQLLDMRTGTAFDESDYEDPESESKRGFRALGWYERRADDPLPHEYIAALRNDGGHGARFEYRSILTDVIGWILERVSGRTVAELLTTELWALMGAEHDADMLLGPLGFPLSDGGLCLTVGDLARFGLLHLDGGRVDGGQVLPLDWVSSITSDDDGLAAAFEADGHADAFAPGAFYHNQWWVLDGDAGVYSGYGIHGQQVFVHGPSETVIAKFSSWPHPIVDDFGTYSAAAFEAICSHLVG
jgi:CubicO group peptidase (beta-lactamase class C family)